MMAVAHHDFIPAAGRRWLLPLYDPMIALLTRERRWRGEILKSLDLEPGDIVVDVGCGTGTLAIMAKEQVPQAQVVGVDPDPDALGRAQKKAARKGIGVTFYRGFGNETAKLIGAARATKLVSSLAFHHMPREMQAETLASMHAALAPGGALRIADFVGGHFGGPGEGMLVRDLTAAGFENARTIGQFRLAFGKVTLVGGERPRA
jgi:ubiquinone/menaquinone biosynthesis C-methylase UbiE